MRETSKRGFKRMIQKEAVLRGVSINDLHKEIRAGWRKNSIIPLKSFSIEEAFFKPCIYYLMAGENIVYIGETESLMGRLSDHIKENKKVFDKIQFVWFNGSRAERLQKEKEEIKFHKPHYNVIHNQWKHEPSNHAIKKYKERTSHKRMRNLLDKISDNLKSKST